MITVTNDPTWFASGVTQGELIAAPRLLDLRDVPTPAGPPAEPELYALLAPTGAELDRLVRWLDSRQPTRLRVLVAHGSGVPPDLDAMLSSLAGAGYSVGQVSSRHLTGLPAVELAVSRQPEAPGSDLAIRLQLASLTRRWRRRMPSVGARVGVVAGVAQRAAEGFADVHVFAPDVSESADILERYGPTVMVHERGRPPSGTARWAGVRYLPAPDDLPWLLTPAELGAWAPDGRVHRFDPDELEAGDGAAGDDVVGRFVARCVRSGSAPALAGGPRAPSLPHELDVDVEDVMRQLEDGDVAQVERRAMMAWRLAVRRYSTPGWWMRALRVSPTPSVSVVVQVTDEVELAHVREEIGAQRDVDPETVVIWCGGSSAPTTSPDNETIVERPHGRSWLPWAAGHIASGELVATWSNGWYDRDHIADLATMWRLSGHTLVARRGQFQFFEATEPRTVRFSDAGPHSLAAVISRQALLELPGQDEHRRDLVEQVRSAGGTTGTLPGSGFVRRAGSDRPPEQRRTTVQARARGLDLSWAGIR